MHIHSFYIYFNNAIDQLGPCTQLFYYSNQIDNFINFELQNSKSLNAYINS
jgi:hypothetical protein